MMPFMRKCSVEVDLKRNTIIRAVFEELENDGNSVVINEINYNSPDGGDAGDWVELYNWGRTDIDISGWVMKDDDDGHQFTVPENTVLAAKGFLVLCRDSADFISLHPGVLNVLGEFDYGLGSGGDAVRLFDDFGELVDEVLYGTELPWPDLANGLGKTMELTDYSSENHLAEMWQNSNPDFGTPGRKNSMSTNVPWLANVLREKQIHVYPNPFYRETRIRIENNGFVPARLTIYGLDGREIVTQIINGSEFVWRGENSAGQKVQPGIYICKVQAGNNMLTAKIIFSK